MFLPDDFLRQFSDSREESIARTIDASPIVSAVIDYFNGKKIKRMVSLPIKELFNRVNGTIVVRSSYDNWPRTPKGLLMLYVVPHQHLDITASIAIARGKEKLCVENGSLWKMIKGHLVCLEVFLFLNQRLSRHKRHALRFFFLLM